MDEQGSLFDLPEGRRRRDKGIQKVASPHHDWLLASRAIAIRLCRELGLVSSDDLREAGVVLPTGAHVNLWGAVFHDSRFVEDGMTQSKRPEAHGRMIRTWRLA